MIARTLDTLGQGPLATLEEAIDADRRGREVAGELVGSFGSGRKA